jgi:hypothetical protein
MRSSKRGWSGFFLKQERAARLATNLEAQMMVIAATWPMKLAIGSLIDAQLASDPQLAQLKRRTTQQQFEQLFNQQLNRKLAEVFNLPQLSVYHMTLATG